MKDHFIDDISFQFLFDEPSLLKLRQVIGSQRWAAERQASLNFPDTRWILLFQHKTVNPKSCSLQYLFLISAQQVQPLGLRVYFTAYIRSSPKISISHEPSTERYQLLLFRSHCKIKSIGMKVSSGMRAYASRCDHSIRAFRNIFCRS